MYNPSPTVNGVSTELRKLAPAELYETCFFVLTEFIIISPIFLTAMSTDCFIKGAKSILDLGPIINY